MRSVLVIGASGPVGGFLLPLLRAHYTVYPASRDARPGWIRGDLNDTGAIWPQADIVISLGPLDAFAAWLARQATLPARIIALSSMSAESKRASSAAAERRLAARLIDSESKVIALAREGGAAATIFRPTLIYGAGTDRSLAPIALFARRWRLLPVPLHASGLRQPVHAADLAGACAAVIDTPATYGKTYALGGGERLRFDAMLLRLRAAVPGFVLPVPLPLFALRAIAGVSRRFGAAAIARLREPLVADNREAERDFGYAPMPFQAGDAAGLHRH